MATTTQRSSFQQELQSHSTFQDSREGSAPQHQRGNRFLSLSLYIVVVVVAALAIDSSWIVPAVHGLLVTPHFKRPNLYGTSVGTLVHHRRTILRRMNFGGDDAPAVDTDPTLTTTTKVASPMRLIHGLKEVIHEYDVFFIDMWGVLHDGKQPYEHVLDTIRKMKQSSTDKVLILLSNSSKRYQHSISNLQQLGFQVDDFHSVITSGEVTYQMLESTIDDGDDNRESVSSSLTKPFSLRQWEPLQSILNRNKQTTTKNVFILGSGDDDVPYCTRCGWTPTNNIYDAHVILARGPFTVPLTPNGKDSDDIVDKVIDRRTDGEDAYQQTLRNILQIAAEQGVPMIISNPDKVRPDAARSPMPGQIGDLYASILRHRQESDTSSVSLSTIPIEPASMIKRIGKPFPDVYAVALQSLSDRVIDKSRICMIGDALETDITGGTMFGIDTIWVLKNGVHSIDIQKTLGTTVSNTNHDILKGANVVLDTFNENNIGTYAEGRKLSPTFVIPYFQW